MDDKLIHDGKRWRIARLVGVRQYRRLQESFPGVSHVWADPQTTAFICPEADALAVHDLPPDPPKPADYPPPA